MDYDKTTIAATYDAARGMQPGVLNTWLDLIAAHAPVDVNLLVDVGCGTGRFTYPLAERFPARVLGIDPSAKMLDVARSKRASDRVSFVEAAAERLPLENGCADLVFMSMMLHHLEDRERAAAECQRVLRPGGRLCVRNTTRDSIFPHPQFFPGFQRIVEQELPARDEVVRLFESCGLRLWGYELVPTAIAESYQDFADKLALRADSFVARLPEAEFESGMAALRAHAATHPGKKDIVDHIHFFVFWTLSALARRKTKHGEQKHAQDRRPEASGLH